MIRRLLTLRNSAATGSVRPSRSIFLSVAGVAVIVLVAAYLVARFGGPEPLAEPVEPRYQ